MTLVIYNLYRALVNQLSVKQNTRRLPIIENYHLDSQIEKTSKLMCEWCEWCEWYESLIPETLRKLDRQMTKLPKGQIGLIFFKDGNIKASLTTPKYDPGIVDRLKNLHYFHNKKPA